MAQIDLNHAAFTGFRLTRRHPSMIAVWGAILFVAQLAFVALLARNGAAEFNAFQAASAARDTAAGQAQMAALMSAIAPAALMTAPLIILFNVLFQTALFRGVLAPAEGGPGFLRLGAAELRQLAVWLLVQVFFGVAAFIYLTATILVTSLISTASPVAASLLFLVACLAGLALALMTIVHLSMAGPATFVEGRVRVFSVWNLTKDAFWPVLGAYLLAFVFGMLVGLLGVAIQLGLLAALGGVTLGEPTPLPTSLGQVFAPLQLLSGVLSAVFGVMQSIILFSTPADVYRQLTGGGAADNF